LHFERDRPLMVSFRTTARALLVVALFGVAAGTAAAMPVDPNPRPPVWKPPKPKPKPAHQIVFPVLGTVDFSDDYGAPRPQGRHEGIDILAPRRALALAAEAGRVRFYTGSSRAGCMLYLDGKSGTTYYYIHLNNDLTNGNDNRGGCKAGVSYAKGLKTGARVSAGQPIGFVGDSGDANGIHPHLHFEVHPHGGASTDPYQRLLAARRMLFYAPPGSTFTLSLTATVIATANESLRVRVNTLRATPGNMTLRRLDRPLVLTVPTYASIERGVAGNIVQLADAKRGERISVWTEAATLTAAASEGKAGAISAERILLPAV
jgi:murein DD-endopeptidase MepM/ murein hydrolase activator NlpD